MVSIIIPAFNEAAQLPATLAAVRQQTASAELILVDAGSTDDTPRLAAAAGARVLPHPVRQRAAQMNAGADVARGDILLFLHADTHLPLSAVALIEHALENPSVLGGGFARRFDSESVFLRMTCQLAEWRTRSCGWFLGDQAIFVRRAAFQQMGGFRSWDLFEDLDFSRRLATAGRVITLHPPVVSSARRFSGSGAIRGTLGDFMLTLRYLAGSREVLTRAPAIGFDR